MKTTFGHLFDVMHEDGGWRCNRAKPGRSPETDASNPGVTLAALDAFRFSKQAREDTRCEAAVGTLLAHWKTRRPLGPCHFGIGSRFLQVEFPFLRYNLFYFVYVLSHFVAARSHASFRQALNALEQKLVDGEMLVEGSNRGLAKLAFCAKGQSSRLATKRYREIVKNLGR